MNNLTLAMLAVLLAAALVGSFNPAMISVFVQVASRQLGRGLSNKKSAGYTLAYVFGLLTVLVLTGLGISFLYEHLSNRGLQLVGFSLVVVTLIGGLLELREYFWYGKIFGLRLHSKHANKVHFKLGIYKSAIKLYGLGIYTGIRSLVILAVPLAAALGVIHANKYNVCALVVLYSVCAILPYLIMIGLIANGTRVSVITKWKEESKASFRLFNGLVWVSLAWLILLTAIGAIQIG